MNFKKEFSREYCSWCEMIRRCYKPNRNLYSKYGGRGIKVCKRWVLSFQNFLFDMGRRPEGTSLERKNNNRGYFKSNCIWAGSKAQNNNRPGYNRLLTFGGKTKTVAQWSEITGIKYVTIWNRVVNCGWETGKALGYE